MNETEILQIRQILNKFNNEMKNTDRPVYLTINSIITKELIE